MAFEDDLRVSWEIEDTLDRFARQELVICARLRFPKDADIPDFDVSAAVILGPDAQDVLLSSNTDDGATNLIAGLHELIANHSYKKLLPVTIRNALLQPQNPLATFFV